MKAPFLSLPENLALMAGAGAGKTHGLISLALHVLGGARESGALPPSRLFAVTFTEKAAAEMKERLRARARALADGRREEPDLEAAFELFGKPFPDAAFWERVHASLGGVFVGTFHALCAQLLRRFAIEAGLDPGFGLLEEGGALELFERCAEQTVLSDLEGDGAEQGEARRLVVAFGFKGRGRGSGLLGLLEKVHAKLAEDGRAAASLPEPTLEGSFEEARGALCAAVRAALQLAPAPAIQGTLAACAEALPLLEAATTADPLRAAAVADELGGAIGLRVSKAAKEVLKPLREEAIPAFRLACGEVVAAPLHRDFVRLLERAEDAYREEKERRGVLDFSDLIQRTRALLRDSESARLEVQARVGAMLVDEFQDTNRLQLELVALLCEQREGAPRPVEADAFAELPLEPAMLACVGDRKQSIYEFRGADVSVFADLARTFEQGTGRVEFLRHNRRSRPALIEVFNRLFAQVMAPGGEAEPWRVEYVPENDDLVAFRPQGPAGPCVELLAVEGENAEQLRAAEARALAGRIAALLGPDGPEVVGKDRSGGELRRAEGRDIAILLRRFTHIDAFRRELLARSIPHVVVRGGGFWASREVVDLRCLLALAGDPSDRLALAAVLRSPLAGLSDATLARLAISGKLGLAALRAGLEELVPADEAARLRPLLGVLDWLEPFARAAGVAPALERAVEALDFEAVLAAGFEGEQRVANVRKLIDWTRSENPAGAWAAAQRMERLAAAGGRESAATLIEESDPSAVRIMTIHQSKGLEFPVVFVPECGAGPRMDNEQVLYDRTYGLCVKPRGEDGRAIATTASKQIQAALLSRQRAESERLFYVAATRARDLLVFSGESRRGAGSWRAQLDRFLQEAQPAGLARIAGPGDLAPAARPPQVASASPAPEAPAVSIAPPRIGAETLLVPVTQLGDFRICPRRHLLAHVVGLEEGPWRLSSFVAERAGAQRAARDGGILLDQGARGGDSGTLDQARAPSHAAAGARDGAARALGVASDGAQTPEIAIEVAGKEARVSRPVPRNERAKVSKRRGGSARQAELWDTAGKRSGDSGRSSGGSEDDRGHVEEESHRGDAIDRGVKAAVVAADDADRADQGTDAYEAGTGVADGGDLVADLDAEATGDADGADELARADLESARQAGTREVGSLVHRILERIDLSSPVPAQLARWFASEGAVGADADELAADVAAFAESDLGRALSELPPARLWRELPFAQALDGGDFVLHLRGQVDVLAVMNDGTALVLDYKHAHRPAGGAERYRFQLSCYALALRSFLPPQIPLRAGVVWLKDRGAPMDVLAMEADGLAHFGDELLTLGRELLRRTAAGDFPVLEDRYCRRQRCGFRYLCHPAAKR